MPSQIQPQVSSRGVGVTLRSVRKAFESGVPVIAGIDLDVAPGEFLAILGPSGCGKSTLLRLIAGLERADSGEAKIQRQSDRRSDIAYVFQDAHLLPWRSVVRNVELPLELAGVARADRRQAAVAAIEQVGLGDAMNRYPAQLSGGMRMRVSLARAMVTNPRLLLLDEPFAALDELTRERLDEQLRELWERRGMTVIFVTHSIIEATFLADRAVVLTRRPARVVLDHRLNLPRHRKGELRADPVLVSEMRLLYDALHRGSEAEA